MMAAMGIATLSMFKIFSLITTFETNSGLPFVVSSYLLTLTLLMFFFIILKMYRYSWVFMVFHAVASNSFYPVIVLIDSCLLHGVEGA